MYTQTQLRPNCVSRNLSRSIPQFPDVGIVNLQARLIQLALDTFDDPLLNLISFGKDLFHLHGRNEQWCLTLDDPFGDFSDIFTAEVLMIFVSVLSSVSSTTYLVKVPLPSSGRPVSNGVLLGIWGLDTTLNRVWTNGKNNWQ